jgi:cyclic-di-GMP phosphodiesterase, flagellum assembly factor TipF
MPIESRAGSGIEPLAGSGMVRLSAIFIAVCMALIAASVGAVLYLHFGLGLPVSAVATLCVLTALIAYNAVAGRLRDRAEANDQISALLRNSGDLARQLAEFGRRLNAMDAKMEAVLERSLATAQPLAADLEELSTLVKQLADTVAAHDVAFDAIANNGAAPATGAAAGLAGPGPISAPTAAPAAPAATVEPVIAGFDGLDGDGIIAAIRSAIEATRVDLYLQPIVTLPQRKVRYYEAMSRLRTEDGEVVAAADFLKFAEAGSLMPKLDSLAVLRCVQVVRRLLVKNRDIGLFCNVAGATLTDSGFPHLLEFIDANRAIAGSLVFEFTQGAVRGMGPIEHESLAALAQRGFRFSMDNLTDLRIEPRELTERGFRFIKAPAALLLNRAGAASTDIHPADFSDLLGRFGIDLIAERIEAENTVVDLLDYDVRFGQGFLFAPPRPVRAEALQSVNGQAAKEPAKPSAAAPDRAAVPPAPTGIAAADAKTENASDTKTGDAEISDASTDAGTDARSMLAKLARVASGRS